MILRMTIAQPIDGFWDGGRRSTFDFMIDGPPRDDAQGAFVRIGSWGANHWFHVALGTSEKVTLGHARRHLLAQAKRAGLPCTFTYLNERR
jgi:hypothetical protein